MQEGWHKPEDMIEVDGHRYPSTYDNYLGQWVADAYHHDEHRLPHTYSDLGRLFPKAKAVEEVPESEHLEPDALERRGLEVGKAKTTKVRPTAATTTTKSIATAVATTKPTAIGVANWVQTWEPRKTEEAERKDLRRVTR